MQVLSVFKASYLWNIKHNRNLKTCLLGSLLILGGINYDFCRFGFPSQESRRNKRTNQALLWHDAKNNSQNDEFNFASHISELTNANCYFQTQMSIPQHVMTLENTLGLPGLPLHWLPLPPQESLQGCSTRHTPPSLPTSDNKPFPPPQSFAQSPMKTPTFPPTSPIQKGGLSVHPRLCFQPGAQGARQARS